MTDGHLLFAALEPFVSDSNRADAGRKRKLAGNCCGID
jgi:hypothetical protein